MKSANFDDFGNEPDEKPDVPTYVKELEEIIAVTATILSTSPTPLVSVNCVDESGVGRTIETRFPMDEATRRLVEIDEQIAALRSDRAAIVDEFNRTLDPDEGVTYFSTPTGTIKAKVSVRNIWDSDGLKRAFEAGLVSRPPAVTSRFSVDNRTYEALSISGKEILDPYLTKKKSSPSLSAELAPGAAWKTGMTLDASGVVGIGTLAPLAPITTTASSDDDMPF